MLFTRVHLPGQAYVFQVFKPDSNISIELASNGIFDPQDSWLIMQKSLHFTDFNFGISLHTVSSAGWCVVKQASNAVLA